MSVGKIMSDASPINFRQPKFEDNTETFFNLTSHLKMKVSVFYEPNKSAFELVQQAIAARGRLHTVPAPLWDPRWPMDPFTDAVQGRQKDGMVQPVGKYCTRRKNDISTSWCCWQAYCRLLWQSLSARISVRQIVHYSALWFELV